MYPKKCLLYLSLLFHALFVTQETYSIHLNGLIQTFVLFHIKKRSVLIRFCLFFVFAYIIIRGRCSHLLEDQSSHESSVSCVGSSTACHLQKVAMGRALGVPCHFQSSSSDRSSEVKKCQLRTPFYIVYCRHGEMLSCAPEMKGTENYYLMKLVIRLPINPLITRFVMTFTPPVGGGWGELCMMESREVSQISSII